MVTDGADTSDASLDESLASLKARSIPVFTVGVGQERFARDIQVTRVETPRAVLKGTSLVVDVVLSQTGYGGADRAAQRRRRRAHRQHAGGDAAGRRRVGDGARALHGDRRRRRGCSASRSPPQDGEQVTQNNARDALIEVRDRREKVLYFEGEPRFEMKFIRRAVEDDKNLQVVILQRTAENKYLRAATSAAPTSWSAASRRRARSCSPIARSSSAASKRRRSRPISCGCSPTSSASAAAAC